MISIHQMQHSYTIIIILFSCTCSYSNTVPESDRVSQLENPTLCTRSDTGLAFHSAIAKLKFITANVSTCSSNVISCDVKLCGVTLPTASSYDLSTNSRYNAFESENGNSNCAGMTYICILTRVLVLLYIHTSVIQ